MAEYIEREALPQKKELGFFLDADFNAGWNACLNAIASIPAADVRPVVLCRDCKHKGWVQEPEHGKSVDYCHLIERCVDKQFFCAAGERKTNCGAMMEER